MEIMTGQRKMDARPLMEYFKPLIQWLQKENKYERPGWSEACPDMRAAKICQNQDQNHVTLTFSEDKEDRSSAIKNEFSIHMFTIVLLLSLLLLQ